MSEDLTDITWDYRVFKQDIPIGKEVTTLFFIVEASYNGEGTLTGITSITDPCVPIGIDMETLQEEFKAMTLAFYQPVLTIEDVPKNTRFINRMDEIGYSEEEDVD